MEKAKTHVDIEKCRLHRCSQCAFSPMVHMQILGHNRDWDNEIVGGQIVGGDIVGGQTVGGQVVGGQIVGGQTRGTGTLLFRQSIETVQV